MIEMDSTTRSLLQTECQWRKLSESGIADDRGSIGVDICDHLNGKCTNNTLPFLHSVDATRAPKFYRKAPRGGTRTGQGWNASERAAKSNNEVQNVVSETAIHLSLCIKRLRTIQCLD